MAALRRGRALTLKHFWKVVARLLFGTLVGLALTLVITIIATPLMIFLPAIALAVFNIAAGLIILPPALIYFVNLYRVLAGDELTDN
jgi:hypothetical protein